MGRGSRSSTQQLPRARPLCPAPSPCPTRGVCNISAPRVSVLPLTRTGEAGPGGEASLPGTTEHPSDSAAEGGRSVGGHQVSLYLFQYSPLLCHFCHNTHLLGMEDKGGNLLVKGGLLPQACLCKPPPAHINTGTLPPTTGLHFPTPVKLRTDSPSLFQTCWQVAGTVPRPPPMLSSKPVNGPSTVGRILLGL